MSESESVDEWPSAEQKAKNVAQATALREQAKAGGLRFSVYLPPEMADWLLGLIEKGEFSDPGEAAYVMLQTQKELEPHEDLRRELFIRMLQTGAEDDSQPGIPLEDFFKKLKEELAVPHTPAIWQRD